MGVQTGGMGVLGGARPLCSFPRLRTRRSGLFGTDTANYWENIAESGGARHGWAAPTALRRPLCRVPAQRWAKEKVEMVGERPPVPVPPLCSAGRTRAGAGCGLLRGRGPRAWGREDTCNEPAWCPPLLGGESTVPFHAGPRPEARATPTIASATCRAPVRAVQGWLPGHFLEMKTGSYSPKCFHRPERHRVRPDPALQLGGGPQGLFFPRGGFGLSLTWPDCPQKSASEDNQPGGLGEGWA